MNFFKRIWKEKVRVGAYFGSTAYELSAFTKGLGEVVIKDSSIVFSKYAFEPALVYPSREVAGSEIAEIHLKQFPPTIKIGKELIFLSKEKEELLSDFAKRNQVPITSRSANWNWLTEPFLDTEFDEDSQRLTEDLLIKNGISKAEILDLREEIGSQMYKYNFDTMLWDWCNLGLMDVLLAMQPKLSDAVFRDFYWRAMEIEQREEQ